MSGFGLARRAVLAGLGGVAASAALAQRAADPPVFETARRQFTQLRPVRIVPSIALTRLDGKVVDFASFRGKVVLVNFWATWCPACRTELPALERLSASLGGAQFQIAAISIDRTGRDGVAAFLRQHKVARLPVYLDPEGRVGDRSGSAPFAIYGMPISYLVGPAGQIEGYILGETDWSSEAGVALIRHYMATAGG